MAKRILSAPEEEWLREHVADPLSEQAAFLGCCTDTVKRLHVQLGLRQYPGAKFQPKRSALWQRPCMRCGDTKRRPRNWFFCRKCRKELSIGN